MRTALDVGIWVLAFLFFLLAFIVNLKQFAFLAREEVQLVLGMLIVAVLLFVDPLAGLMMGLGLLILFYRSHVALMPAGLRNFVRDGNYMVEVTDYITPEHLEKAQSNIFDELNERARMVGVEDPYGGLVYDTQGAFVGMPGGDASGESWAPAN